MVEGKPVEGHSALLVAQGEEGAAGREGGAVDGAHPRHSAQTNAAWDGGARGGEIVEDRPRRQVAKADGATPSPTAERQQLGGVVEADEIRPRRQLLQRLALRPPHWRFGQSSAAVVDVDDAAVRPAKLVQGKEANASQRLGAMESWSTRRRSGLPCGRRRERCRERIPRPRTSTRDGAPARSTPQLDPDLKTGTPDLRLAA